MGAASAALPLLAAQAPVRHASGLALRPNPQATVISGSATGPLLDVNNAGSGALNVFGVLGSVSNGPYGIGLLGYGANPSSGNIGVTGLDSGPGGYGTIGYSNYSSTSNATAGTQTTGLYGVSNYGSGVVGQTQSTKTSSGGVLAGVAGIDNTDDGGFNDGVFGKTTSGAWAVEGESSDGAYGGVLGSATSGYGVEGTASIGIGVLATAATGTALFASNNSGTNPAMSVTALGASDALDVSAGSLYGIKVSGGSSPNDALYSSSSNADGVYGFTSGTTSAGVFGQSDQANDSGCNPQCNGSSGVIGVTDSDTDGFGDYEAGVLGNAYFAVLGYPANGGFSFIGTNIFGQSEISIDSAGNIITNGYITTLGATTTTVTPTSHGYYAQSYATQAMSRILEDENSAGIVNGAGMVHIDPAFTEAVGNGTYQVFLTPKGDSNGLYVTEETPTSFVVRESHGGRSTIGFDYRIVAHPYGHAAERMAVASSMEAFEPGPLRHGHASLKGLLAHVAAERSRSAAVARRASVQAKYVKRASPSQGRFSLPALDLSALTRH